MKNYRFAKIKTRTFPTMQDVNNPYIFGNVKCVINVSEKENGELKDAYERRSIAYHHFPLRERVEDMGWENILKAVEVLLANIKESIPTIVHCKGGNNRSPLVVEAAYYALTGNHLQDYYQDSYNHLIYNVEMGFLPFSLEEIERKLQKIGNSMFI